MVDLDEYIKLLAGLLSVVDPIGAIPLFISLTDIVIPGSGGVLPVFVRCQSVLRC